MPMVLEAVAVPSVTPILRLESLMMVKYTNFPLDVLVMVELPLAPLIRIPLNGTLDLRFIASLNLDPTVAVTLSITILLTLILDS